MEKYSLSDDLPPSELITLHELRPYLERAGGAPFEAHLHSFNQVIWFRAGSGVHLAMMFIWLQTLLCLVSTPSSAGSGMTILSGTRAHETELPSMTSR